MVLNHYYLRHMDLLLLQELQLTRPVLPPGYIFQSKPRCLSYQPPTPATQQLSTAANGGIGIILKATAFALETNDINAEIQAISLKPQMHLPATIVNCCRLSTFQLAEFVHQLRKLLLRIPIDNSTVVAGDLNVSTNAPLKNCPVQALISHSASAKPSPSPQLKRPPSSITSTARTLLLSQQQSAHSLSAITSFRP